MTNTKARAILPVDVTRVHSHIPCESCGVKRSAFRATLDPPGRARVTHRLCENCIEALRLTE